MTMTKTDTKKLFIDINDKRIIPDLIKGKAQLLSSAVIYIFFINNKLIHDKNLAESLSLNARKKAEDFSTLLTSETDRLRILASDSMNNTKNSINRIIRKIEQLNIR